MAPQNQGSFFVTAGAAGLIGALPYALFGSIAELRVFLEESLRLHSSLIAAVIESVERGQCFGRNIRLTDAALEAVTQNRVSRYRSAEIN